MKLSFNWKPAFIATIAIFSFTKAAAQNAYIKIGGGYNFGLSSTIEYQTKKYPNYSSNGAPSGFIQNGRASINHGKGGVFGGAFGYMLNNNLGFEIGVNYFAGSKNELKIEDNGQDPYLGGTVFPFNGISLSATETHTSRSEMILIQPSLVIAAGLSKLNPYTRIGLVITKGKLENSYTYSNPYGQSMETENKYFGGIGFGLQAALGLDFRLNDKVSIYTEGTFNYVTYSPQKGEVTKYTFNSNDLLPTLTTSQKEIIFEDEQSISSYSNQPTSEPSTGPKERFYFNSIGINLGLKFNL